jgi:hypothetical protein
MSEVMTSVSAAGREAGPIDLALARLSDELYGLDEACAELCKAVAPVSLPRPDGHPADTDAKLLEVSASSDIRRSVDSCSDRVAELRRRVTEARSRLEV